MMWKKRNVAVLAIGVLALGIGAGTIGMRTAAAEQQAVVVPPAVKVSTHRKPYAEPKEYRVEVRLMEALPRPTTFHRDQEVLCFPAMAMADDKPMTVWISQSSKGTSQASVEAPDEARAAVSLTTSIHHMQSGRVTVDMTYQDHPLVGRSSSPPPIRPEHLTADIPPGKVAKVALPKRGDHPRRWFEVIVHGDPCTGSFMPPAKVNVYMIQLNMHEKRGTEEKLFTPTYVVLEGKQVEFLSGAEASVAGATMLASGLRWTATIKKLLDGRLRLDMCVEKNRKTHEDKQEVQVQSSSLHIIKVTVPDKKLNFTLDPVDAKSPPLDVQVVVSELKQ